MKPSFFVFSDLSPRSRRAAWYAALLANATQGRVVLVHVEPLPPIEPELGVYTLSTEYQRQVKLVHTALQELARQLPAPAVVEDGMGSVPEVLTTLVNSWQPAVLVLGTVAEYDILDAIWYNQTLPALRDSGLPVLLVPEEAAQDPALPRLIAIAADGQEFRLPANSAVGAVLLGSWLAAFSVVHVATPGSPGIDRAVAAVRRSALLSPAAPCIPYEVRQQPCRAGIVQATQDVQADLLVLLTRPRTLVGSLLGSGVAVHVVRNCPVPTLLLPMQAVDGADPVAARADEQSYSCFNLEAVALSRGLGWGVTCA